MGLLGFGVALGPSMQLRSACSTAAHPDVLYPADAQHAAQERKVSLFSAAGRAKLTSRTTNSEYTYQELKTSLSRTGWPLLGWDAVRAGLGEGGGEWVSLRMTSLPIDQRSLGADMDGATEPQVAQFCVVSYSQYTLVEEKVNFFHPHGSLALWAKREVTPSCFWTLSGSGFCHWPKFHEVNKRVVLACQTN
jgi:hypothetical protein